MEEITHGIHHLRRHHADVYFIGTTPEAEAKKAKREATIRPVEELNTALDILTLALAFALIFLTIEKQLAMLKAILMIWFIGGFIAFVLLCLVIHNGKKYRNTHTKKHEYEDELVAGLMHHERQREGSAVH